MKMLATHSMLILVTRWCCRYPGCWRTHFPIVNSDRSFHVLVSFQLIGRWSSVVSDGDRSKTGLLACANYSHWVSNPPSVILAYKFGQIPVFFVIRLRYVAAYLLDLILFSYEALP